MKRTTIILSFMLVLTLMLGACSTGTTGGTLKSKELTIGFGIDIQGVNPKDCYETKHSMLSIVYDTLVNYDNGKITSGLAESWEVNEDKTEYTFKLKEGVKFSDGTYFNAEAVKKNLTAISKNPKWWWLAISQDFKSIEIIDEYKFKLIMTKPSPAVLSNLLPYCPLGMVAPSTITSFDPVTYEGSIGTGPYKLSDYEVNRYYTFVKNEHYWGEEQEWDKVTLKIIPDSEARILALATGEIDIIVGSSFLSIDAINALKGDSKYTAKISDTLVDKRNIKVNSKSNILKDDNIRKAIAYAINREEIVSSIFSGYEDISNSWLIEDLQHCNVSIEPFTFNIEKAKNLLDEAGWIEVDGSNFRQKDGQQLKIKFGWIADYQTDKELGYAVKGYLENIGINVDEESAELATWTSNFYDSKYDLVIIDMTPIPYQPYINIRTLNNQKSYGQFIDGLPMKQQLHNSIETIISSGNDEDIANAFKFILTTVHNEAVIIPIATKKEVVLYNNDKIKDFEFSNLPGMICPDNIKSK